MEFDNGKQISPCIVSKVRHALQLKSKRPFNDKKCTDSYWVKTINQVIKLEYPLIPNGVKQKAIDSYKKYMDNTF